VNSPNGIVVKKIKRVEARVITILQELGVATVHEALGPVGLMHPEMRPIYRGAKIAGSAVTALVHPGDNWMLHVAAEVVDQGDILVVAVSSENRDGAFGDLLATSLRAQGAIGLIIDAGCRDLADLTKMQFPVWSRAIFAKGTVKATLGSVNVPVICAGAQVMPGDVIVADDDGVVVVPRQKAVSVASAGKKRIEREALLRKRLEAGELRLDIKNMRPELEENGLKYIDGPVDWTSQDQL
jgi:4-hydroxy-4-methyl-2-oxoglutarate aldolase